MTLDERLTGPRVEGYWVQLLDVNDGPVRVLDGVTDGRVQHNVDATIRGGFAVTTADNGSDIDWATSRLQPWVHVNGIQWPLGVYLPGSPEARWTATGRTWVVPCLDKTSILDQSTTVSTFAVPAGAVVTDAVASIITGQGEERLALTGSPLTLPAMMVWKPGTSWLRVINDLLEAINYRSLWVDREGQFRAEPYTAPGERTPVAVFAEGESAIHSPDWSRTQDVASVPNRVVATTTGGASTPALTSVVDNVNPASPYSIPSRGGRVVSKPYENVEAVNQATLDALAARYLADSSRPAAYLDVAHAAVPLWGNDVVGFVSGDVTTRAVVNEFTVNLSVGSLMSGKWVEVDE